MCNGAALAKPSNQDGTGTSKERDMSRMNGPAVISPHQLGGGRLQLRPVHQPVRPSGRHVPLPTRCCTVLERGNRCRRASGLSGGLPAPVAPAVSRSARIGRCGTRRELLVVQPRESTPGGHVIHAEDHKRLSTGRISSGSTSHCRSGASPVPSHGTVIMVSAYCQRSSTAVASHSSTMVMTTPMAR